LVAPFKRSMISRMATEFSSEIDYTITSTRYPTPEWGDMNFREKLDEKMLGGASVSDMVRKFKPDLVYSDSPLYATQFEVVSFLLRKKLPLVLHLRGDIWREHFAAFASASAKRRILSLQQNAYDWAAVLLAAKVTPICQWLQTVVRRHVPRKRCEVVYQGVDPNQFLPEPGGKPTLEVLKPAVAIVQNHSVLPKVQGLLGFKSVVERLPRVHFYVAEGEAWAQQYLRSVKEHYAHTPNVHFVKDITTPKTVSRLITACDFYVLASGLDCCPTTVLEASLLERPVLGSRVGGVPETIRYGYTGWSIENGFVDEWINRIEALTNDAKLCRRLGIQGRRWVSEKFGWATIALQVERLIIHEVA